MVSPPQWSHEQLEGSRRRAVAARKATTRRAALERLEERALMAVLPTPTVAGPVNISGQVGLSTDTSNESTPSIAIDQNNPQHLVAVWTRHEVNVPTPPFIDV